MYVVLRNCRLCTNCMFPSHAHHIRIVRKTSLLLLHAAQCLDSHTVATVSLTFLSSVAAGIYLEFEFKGVEFKGGLDHAKHT